MALRLGIKKFLNRPGFQDQAYIIAEVENSSKKNPRNKWDAQPNVKLQIADCDRKVSFDFDWETKAGRANNLRKIDILLDSLNRFREALEAEQKLYEERAKKGWNK